MLLKKENKSNRLGNKLIRTYKKTCLGLEKKSQQLLTSKIFLQKPKKRKMKRVHN